MKKVLALLAVLLLAAPIAQAATVELLAGAGVGHELGRPAGESFNVAWFGTTAKTWNNGETKLMTVARYGQYNEQHVDGWGGKVILSDLLWQSPTTAINFKVQFDVGFMDKYNTKADGSHDVAPTVGGGLTMQLTKNIAAWSYYEAFQGPDKWIQTSYFGLCASTAFSIGGQ